MGKRGPKPKFDRTTVLRQALDVFCEVGYVGASINMLSDATGLVAPSIYAAFGSKEGLFREAVELHAHDLDDCWDNVDLAPRDAVKRALRTAVGHYLGTGDRSCFLLVLTNEYSLDGNISLCEFFRRLRGRDKEKFRAILTQGIADGLLGPETQVERASTFYATVVHGLAIRAQDGEKAEALLDTVDSAMAAWDRLVAPPPEDLDVVPWGGMPPVVK